MKLHSWLSAYPLLTQSLSSAFGRRTGQGRNSNLRGGSLRWLMGNVRRGVVDNVFTCNRGRRLVQAKDLAATPLAHTMRHRLVFQRRTLSNYNPAPSALTNHVCLREGRPVEFCRLAKSDLSKELYPRHCDLQSSLTPTCAPVKCRRAVVFFPRPPCIPCSTQTPRDSCHSPAFSTGCCSASAGSSCEFGLLSVYVSTIGDCRRSRSCNNWMMLLKET
jgi:hypothetical protein